MVTTIFISKSMHLQSSSLLGNVQLYFISDGCDQGGFGQAGSVSTYLSRMQEIGSNNLRELIKKYNSSDHPIDCVVYDPLVIWVLDVAKEFGLFGAAFFTQILSLSEATVKFDVWDTAGQERYHSLAPMYYRGAAAAIVVYDISSVVSIRVVNFESIMVYLEWIHWNL